MLKTLQVPVLSLSHLAAMTRHYFNATAGDREDSLQSAKSGTGFFVNLSLDDGSGFPDVLAVSAWLATNCPSAEWILFEEDGQVVDLPTYQDYAEQEALEDAQLNAGQLAKKYERTANGHPCLSLSLWRHWVQAGNTIDGYWEWVAEQMTGADYCWLLEHQTL
ncbi:hypothetical protein [Chromobacterium vaccinii]|uniref:DUF5983 family protein n=1 Tax=Chromobacterium vaccinii TaxID=1108595 RepID=UPI00345B3969